jgi:splicing factor 3A subunit 1
MGIQGIIRPPPEIRAVADKTAIFVAKNGRDFETRILNSGKGKTPKFAFLHSSSPFHAYYEDRIVFYSNGGGKKEEKKKEDGGDETSGKDTTNAKIAAVGNGETQNDQQKQADGKDEALSKDDEKNKDAKVESIVTQQKGDSTKTARKAKSIVDPVAKALLAQRAKIKQMNEPSTDKSDKKDNQDDANESNQKPNPMPPRLLYTSALPPKVISQSQLEIIKLTAQFVALNGGNKNNVFLRELTIKEWQNPLYGFLQPRHGHYAYFTQLVDIYRRILQRTVVLHEQKISEKKERNEGDISGTGTSLLTMTSLKKMVGMDSIDHAESTTLQLQEEIRSINNMAGNIHSCLEYAAYHAEYDRFKEEKRKAELEKMMNEGRGDGILGGSSRVDWHDFVVVETIDFAVDEVVESLPPPPLQTPKEEITTEQKPVADDDMEASSDDDDDQENIEVVPDYTPKVVSSQAKFASEARTHVIDPITKKSIPIADMSEHMRIQLLDPKWAAEKGRFMEKQKDSNLVGGDMIARNVNAFTRARGDLFGSSVSFILLFICSNLVILIIFLILSMYI